MEQLEKTLLPRAIGICETVVIRTLVHQGALQAIPADGSTSFSELAKNTSASPALLERLLRYTLVTGFLSVNDKGQYAHTANSLPYIQGAADPMIVFYDTILLPLMRLPEYLKLRGDRVDFEDEDSSRYNLTSFHVGQEGKMFFEIIGQDPDMVLKFQQLLAGTEFINPFTGVYDFGKLATSEPGRAVFVDVGGGRGHAIAKMLEALPEIKPEQCVLQDRPEAIELAQKSDDIPSTIQFMPYDFFTPQPVKGAKAYHLRFILHDYSDVNAVKILKQIVPAMAPDSKVLIGEQVIPETGAPGLSGLMDIFLLSMAGKERTEAGFAKILDQAGLKLDAVYPTSEGRTFGIVEASLK
jgi:hypothetical protein